MGKLKAASKARHWAASKDVRSVVNWADEMADWRADSKAAN